MSEQEKVVFNVYEVFAQPSHSEPHRHVGSVLAASPEMALLLAKENHLRREPCINLWVVQREQIHATSYEDPELFAREFSRSWREASGYPENARRWQKYRRQPLQIDDLVKE